MYNPFLHNDYTVHVVMGEQGLLVSLQLTDLVLKSFLILWSKLHTGNNIVQWIPIIVISNLPEKIYCIDRNSFTQSKLRIEEF